MYFNSNEPYSESGDRWTWDPNYNDGAGALVTGGDGIADYTQDPSDTYDGEDPDDNPDNDNNTYTYDAYWDDYLYQAYKSAYANNVGYDVTGVGPVSYTHLTLPTNREV